MYGKLTNVVPTVGGVKHYSEQAGVYRFKVRIKKRGFMAKGLRASLAKIPAEFKDQIRGP